MKNVLYLSVILIVLGGCSKNTEIDAEESDFVSIYGGKPLKGTATGQRSQNGVINYNWEGEGDIAFIEQTADSVSIVFMADFGDEGEINFKVRGAYNGRSFHTADQQNPAVYFEIKDERIASSIVNDEQRMRIEGMLEEERAVVQMQVEFLKESGIFPAGAVFDLQFDTAREVDEHAGEGSGCPLRLVPIWSPSGVTMGMVPDC